jgi:hypothetical protein
MSILRTTLLGCAVVIVSGAFGQVLRTHVGQTSGSVGGNVTAQDFSLTVPNLIWVPGAVLDPFDNVVKTGFRPEVINLDGLTIRDVLVASGVTIDANLIVQTIEVTKKTPFWKCTAFVSGPGAGINTNFDSGLKKATSADLDKKLINLAFGIPQDQVALGNRALLFSPPGTTYTLYVTYVVRDVNGRIGKPITVKYIVTVQIPSRADILANIEYFSTVAAGVTQKPKIDGLALKDLNDALAIADDLGALIAFETAVATYSIDFPVLRDKMDSTGKYDARFFHNYMIDSDEEPIGCLLVEMANAALWH